jgi:M6 family metalloprotease-like protein
VTAIHRKLGRSDLDVFPIGKTCIAGVVSLAVAALVFAATPLRAGTRSACDPPALGFGAGEGRNSDEMPPTVGVLRIAMLFVDFGDSPASVNPQSIYEAQVPRLVDWYRTVSYGRLRIEVVPLARWIRLPRTLEEYTNGRFEGAVNAAVEAADPTFDFSSFDAMYIVPSMPSLASTVIDDVPIRLDGADIHAWAWLATGSLERLSFVAIHETGHLLGLPDLYNERNPSSQHGWDVMTAAPSGGGMFAWHRWKLGWLDAGQVVCIARKGAVDVTLSPLERPGGKKAIISRVRRELVVVEVRQRFAEDASICRTGILVYRVDLVAGAPENVGSRRQPIQMHPAQRDDRAQWDRCGREWRAPYTRGRVSAWGHRIQVLKRLPDGSYRIRFTRR